MPDNPDIEQDEIEQYKPPLKMMTNFTIIAMWVALGLAIMFNQTEVPADPWWVLGIPFVGGITFAIKLGPEVVKNASAKVVSFLHGDSIMSNEPFGEEVPESPGLPKCGVFLPGSVSAPHFAVGTYVGTKEIIVVPTGLALKFGKNLVINCWTQAYSDHTQLPPSVYEVVQKNPYYNRDMIVEFGTYPAYVHAPTRDQTAQFKRELRADLSGYGFDASQECLDKMYLVMERWACIVSPFHFGDHLPENVLNNMDFREKATNQDLVRTRQTLKEWQAGYAKLVKQLNPRSPQPPASMIEKLGSVGAPDQNQGGDQNGRQQ